MSIPNETDVQQEKPLSLSKVLVEEFNQIHNQNLNPGEEPEKFNHKSSDPSEVEKEKENERLEIIFDAVHNLDEKRSALCLSGGGIRSATFCLGVLQGLARHKLLDRFHYLSTVSGGGYIGGWLTAWIHREQLANKESAKDESAKTVFDILADGQAKPDKSVTTPEPTEITHLRAYSNLLTPKIGLLSVDTWTLIAIYLRNLFLNWLVLVPLILAVLLIPRIYAALAKKNFSIASFLTQFDINLTETYIIGRLSSFALVYGLILTAMSFAYINSHRPSIRDFENPNKPQDNIQDSSRNIKKTYSGETNDFKLYFILPLLAAVFLLTIGRAWRFTEVIQKDAPTLASFPDWWAWWQFALGGVGLMFLAWLLTFFAVYIFFGKSVFRAFVSNKNKIKRIGELIILLLTGALGGISLWLLSLPEKIATIVSPKINYIYPTDQFELYQWLDGPRLMLVFIFMGIFSNGIGSRWNSDDDREWWARAAAYVLLLILVWTAIYALVILIPNYLPDKTTATLNIPLGLIGSIAGFVTILFSISSKTPANDRQAEKAGKLTTVLHGTVKFAAPIFTAFLVVFLSFFTDFLIVLIKFLTGNYYKPVKDWESPFKSLENFPNLEYNGLIENIHNQTSFLFLISMFIVLLGISFLMARFININQFSLHSLYRNRLIRTYLGASNRERKPNSFTDFDQYDDLKMSELAEVEGSKITKPFHIINMTWNLVHGKKLEWQNRMATTFTVSPLHSGSYVSGYRRSEEYGGEKPESISLGTALTISGAAASPNMGYYSSTFVTFLMTLFNARLGWWLGNPQHENSYKSSGPTSALGPMIDEAWGRTAEDKKYIYLSDGGHFENLGLYEMVLRRCHNIFVVDASRDPDYKFENLGNAIRRIRVDLGINIEIENYPRKKADPGPYCAIGKIHYSEIDGTKGETKAKNKLKDGTLIYIKPSLVGHEPTDIFNYAQDNLQFPHEPTTDMWFSEQQFESYRALGFYAIDQIFQESLTGKGFSNLEKVVRAYIAQANPVKPAKSD